MGPEEYILILILFIIKIRFQFRKFMAKGGMIQINRIIYLFIFGHTVQLMGSIFQTSFHAGCGTSGPRVVYL